MSSNNNVVNFDDFELPNPNDIVLFNNTEIEKEDTKVADLDEKRKEFEIEVYGRVLNKREIYKEIIYRTEKNETKIDIAKAVKYIIKTFNPVRSQEKLYMYKDGVYNEINLEILKKIIKKVLPDTFKRTSYIRELADLTAIDDEVFIDDDIYEGIMNKQSDYLVNCKNGILNIETMELKEHTPELLTTMQINANWDENAQYPLFQKFLDRVVPNKDNQLVLQEMLGYSLTKSIKSKKRIFILQGEGDTGKSTFLNATLTSLLKKNARANVPLHDLENHQFALVHLKDKTVNIFADLKSGALADTGKLKAITGGDEIALEAKGKDLTFDKVFCKLIFSTNHLPANLSQDKTDAFYNRLTIIKFNEIIKEEEKDEKLEEKLKGELDGIFLWAMQGLKRLVDNKFKFSRSEEIEENVNRYKLSNNSLLQFIEDNCTITKNKEDYILAANLHEAYKKYCKDELDQKEISPENIRKQLETKYNVFKEKITDKTKKQANGRYSRPWAYTGIKFKDELLDDNEKVDMKWAKITEKVDR